MNQDPNQYPQNQPYEPTIPASSSNADNQGNPPPPPYTGDSTQYAPPPSPYPGSGYPAPSSPYGGGQNYNSAPVYPPSGPQTPSNPYENPSPYGQSAPQSGMFPAQNPYGAPGGVSPYPGYIPPQPPKKRRTGLWITLSVVGGILILGIIGCSVLFSSLQSYARTADANAQATITSLSDSTPDSTSDSTPDSTGDNSNTNAGETKVALAATGKSHVLQDVTCTVTSVKIVPGDDEAKPKSGDEFIVIHVQIKNNSSDVQSYNGLDFTIINSAGKSSDHIYFVPSAYEDQLSFGDLPAGGNAEGDLVFEVASSDHTQTLSWDPVANDFATTPGEAKWVLDL
jgi:uncharacterized protein (UPF0333 family)